MIRIPDGIRRLLGLRDAPIGAPPPPPDGTRSILAFLFADADPAATRSAVHRLPTGPASPFAALPGTHNGRFTPLGERFDTPMLALSATVDGDARTWIAALVDALGPGVGHVFARCDGWPGAGDRTAVVDWIDAHRVEPTLPFATWEAPVDRIRSALARTDEVRDFALTHQASTPAQRHAAFVHRFRSETR